jgi:glycosyltransferase involved in cell wall biosynthesis
MQPALFSAASIAQVNQPSQPLISVIIRSMGRPVLQDALASLARQTYPNLEVVLVNACGPEHPETPRLEGLHIRRIDNPAPVKRSRAANLGLAAAAGEFAIFLDDDDWFEPEHLETLASLLIAQPDAAAAYAGVRCVEVQADTEDSQGKDAATAVRIFNDEFNPARLLVENYIPIHALLFRHAQSPKSPSFDESLDLFEDWDFWLQLLGQGRFIHHASITAIYRIHPGSGAGVQAEQESALVALDKVLAKWRTRWTPQQLRDLVAHVRLMTRIVEQQHEYMASLDIKQQANVHAIERLEATLRKHEQLIQDQLVQFDAQQRQLEEKTKQLTEAMDQLAEANQWRLNMEASWHYRLNQDLRIALRKLASAGRLLRQGKLQEAAWRFLLNLYASPIARPIVAAVPISLKRSIRDYFSRSLRSSEVPAFSGNISSDPLISIIIPVYQHPEYLARCIESALAQTWRNLEVIVVDDASPDPRVGEILAGFSDAPRLLILRNPHNCGIAVTQNRALTASQGEIIGFLDCDDFLAPEAVEVCHRYWRENTVYSHSARINIDADGKEVNRICFSHLPRADYFAENLEAMYATHFKMIRRDVFARLGLFDARFDSAQDYDYLMRVAAHYPSNAFVYVPQFVYSHRLHAKQTTETSNERQNRAVTQIKREAVRRREIQAGRYDRKLSIIMLSFGKHTQTLQAVESLKATIKVPHEIILFDNGSDAPTVEFLKQNLEGRFDGLKVFYNDRNLGPAAGRREALRHASGDWFIVFDNDEIAEPGWLEELLVRAESDPNIGAVTCKVIFPNRELQCCGGRIQAAEEDVIELTLIDRGVDTFDLASAELRDCDWCPIGATLFTRNPVEYLHAGYPNVFEDAGVSMALRRQGLRLVNSPASWVWHEHITFRKNVEMGPRYTQERYDPKRMLLSVASFYKENGRIIYDEYIWRENQLNRKDLAGLRTLLERTYNEAIPG